MMVYQLTRTPASGGRLQIYPSGLKNKKAEPFLTLPLLRNKLIIFSYF